MYIMCAGGASYESMENGPEEICCNSLAYNYIIKYLTTTKKTAINIPQYPKDSNVFQRYHWYYNCIRIYNKEYGMLNRGPCFLMIWLLAHLLRPLLPSMSSTCDTQED
jgi:hypothetical protein